MILLRSPHKKVQGIIKKIEKDRVTRANISLLMEILEKEPALVPEVIDSIIDILNNNGNKNFKSAIWALNVVANKDIGVVSRSVDVIVKCLHKNMHKNEIMRSLDLLYKINEKYPDRMNIVIPGLILNLQNMDESIREKVYLLLAPIAEKHPEFFKDYTKQLIRVLNGLNVDERIYAIRLVKIISKKDPTIVRDTYDLLTYMQLNHPSRELRLEAVSAIKELKLKEDKPPAVPTEKIKPGIDETARGQELMRTITPSGEPVIETVPPVNEPVTDSTQVSKNNEGQTGNEIKEEDRELIEIVLKKTTSNNVIKSAMMVDLEGNAFAHSGPFIDSSFLRNLKELFSNDTNEKFRSRISLEHADKKIVAVRFGTKAILVVLTDVNAPIGMILHELNKSVEKIDKLVDPDNS